MLRPSRTSTLRLSLIWLGLISPSDIPHLDADLVGSREIRGTGRQTLETDLETNGRDIPKRQFDYCSMLKSSIQKSDGFRRRAVPILLYRYFADMADSFRLIRQKVVQGTPYALVVGTNHTVLGGCRFDIDTPEHLVNIAENCGWSLQEVIKLQTYSRYGYNVNNSVTAERLILLVAL